MAYHSGDSPVAGTFLVASEIRWSCHSFHSAWANKLARRAWVWAQTPLRTHAHDSYCVVGWSAASWACRREGSSHTNTAFLEEAECRGQRDQLAQLHGAPTLQAAADGEGELMFFVCRGNIRRYNTTVEMSGRCGQGAHNTGVQLQSESSWEAQKPFVPLKRKNWQWRLVDDPSFASARKKAQKGHDVLDCLRSAVDETLDNSGLHS